VAQAMVQAMTTAIAAVETFANPLSMGTATPPI
jgi:hypothetical protein